MIRKPPPIRIVAILASSVMPGSCNKLLDMLAVPADERMFANLSGDFQLKAGVELPVPEGVFPRYVESESA